jgi:guanylate kinase
MVEKGEFIEYAFVFGQSNYGTPKAYVEEQTKKGTTCFSRSTCRAPCR